MITAKENGPTAGNRGQFQNLTRSQDSAPSDAERKLFNTLAARYALTGHCLHRTPSSDGTVAYYVERWGLIRHLPTVAAVEQFLIQIGG